MKRIIATILMSAFLLGGCVRGDVSGAVEEKKTQEDLKASIDVNLKPNEAGKIMVLMYHNIGSEESEWTRTPENFIKDLNVLYEKGYRPISLHDYVSGNITTEQGFTPVVITFDDGNKNNFEYLENGDVSPESAVGLLVDFNKIHKDFPLEATFFVNGRIPFKQGGLESKKLDYILESGMDIGNHTRDHMNLKNATAEEIQEQIGSQAQYIESLLGDKAYRVNTLALPFGGRPKDESLIGFLLSGSFKGTAYENIAVLNVGWNPGQSPYSSGFNPLSIPRVRASETKVDNVGLYNYLDYFDKNPGERFVSDGIAEIVTVPEDKKESLSLPGDRELYTYNQK